VLAIGARSAGDLRRFTASLPPNRCAAHREPLSCVYVCIRRRATALLSTYGGASRSATPRSATWRFSCGGVRWGATGGWGGVASDNRQDSNYPRLGASAEGRLAWPQASSPSGHVCKPTRPSHPPVALRHAPSPPRRTDKDCNAGERLGTGVLAIGARSAVSVRRPTTGLPPNRCAAHPEPSSCVDVYIRRRGDSFLSTCGGAWRSAMWGPSGVASDNR
jgi:hypothetical protein